MFFYTQHSPGHARLKIGPPAQLFFFLEDENGGVTLACIFYFWFRLGSVFYRGPIGQLQSASARSLVSYDISFKGVSTSQLITVIHLLLSQFDYCASRQLVPLNFREVVVFEFLSDNNANTLGAESTSVVVSQQIKII